MQKSLNRYSPLTFKNGKQLKNRVVVPAMASETSTREGFATEKTVAHYECLAQSGAAMITVEYTYVDRSGRSELNQLGIDTDLHVKGLKKIATAIHSHQALAGIQLTHSLAKTEAQFTDGRVLGPSNISVPVKDRQMPVPTALSLDEISHLKESFYHAVERSVLAGFDLIEFHAAHGYGLNQFLSPLTNRRPDHYGASLEGNLRILLEIVRFVKHTFPKLLISVRMPGQDFLEGGLTQQNAVYIAKELERAGADLINVSSGIGGWRRPRDRTGEGYLVNEAAYIQKHVSTPVMGVGGIETGDYIDAVIGSKQIALAAVGRAILKDPAVWGSTYLSANASRTVGLG